MAAKRSGPKAEESAAAQDPPGHADAATAAAAEDVVDADPRHAEDIRGDQTAEATDARSGSETAEPTEAATGDQATAATEARLQELEREAADLRDRLARARADYQNLQRRVERDALLEKQRVKARFLEDFLQVYEYGQMAAFEAERNPGPLADGVKIVVREFDRLLEKEGVERVGQAGEPFDREVHEAVATEAADGIAAGHVSRVIAPGYRLGQRVLRYAKVAVAPSDDEAE